MDDNPSSGDTADTVPIESVSWDTVHTFLDILNAKAQGTAFRLPSEVEWEYAYRAETDTRFYWGDDPSCAEIDDHAWWTGNSPWPDPRAWPVGGRQPNAWGLYDMSGSVSQWCEDKLHDNYAGTPFLWRVLRGRNWHCFGYWCRSAFRDSSTPIFADSPPSGLGSRPIDFAAGVGYGVTCSKTAKSPGFQACAMT